MNEPINQSNQIKAELPAEGQFLVSLEYAKTKYTFPVFKIHYPIDIQKN